MKIFDFEIELGDKFQELARIEVAGILLSILIVVFRKLFAYIKISIPLWFSTLFNRRASVIAKIHIILRKLLYRLEGDRASLFIFTGGDVVVEDTNLVMSCINEVTEDGISSALYERRKLNVSFFNQFLKEIIEKEYLFINDIPVEDNIPLSAFFVSQNTKKANFQLIRSLRNNKPYGFLCVEFCRDQIINDLENRAKKEMRSARDKLINLVL